MVKEFVGETGEMKYNELLMWVKADEGNRTLLVEIGSPVDPKVLDVYFGKNS